MFVEGEYVSYKAVTGVIAFVTEQSISIMVRKGKHKSQDVRIVVYRSDFKDVIREGGK